MRRSEQRRAAVFALYQHDLTQRPLDDLFERDAARSPARSRTRRPTTPTSSTSTSRATRTNWTIDRIAPLERAILRTALLEMLHPELVEADRPIPPEGAIDEAVETAKAFCGAEAPGLRQRHPRRRAARARSAGTV